MTEIDFIEKLLQEMSPILSDHYRNRANIGVSHKLDANDVLTEADEAVQREIMNRIKTTFPDDQIMAEELNMNTSPDDRQGRCWIIDPIDGTQNFVRGMFPMFGISVAFTNNGHVQAGGVDVSLMEKRFLAARGQGATCNGIPIHCSQVDKLSLARVEIDFGHPLTRQPTLENFSNIMLNAGQVRCHCAAVVGLCSVAAGEMDAYFHTYLNPWDFAASLLIIEEAGGQFTRLDGSKVDIFQGGEGLVATNGRIHQECLDTLP